MPKKISRQKTPTFPANMSSCHPASLPFPSDDVVEELPQTHCLIAWKGPHFSKQAKTFHLNFRGQTNDLQNFIFLTWEYGPPGRVKSSSKQSFSGSMLSFGGVVQLPFHLCSYDIYSISSVYKIHTYHSFQLLPSWKHDSHIELPTPMVSNEESKRQSPF